MWGCGEEKSPLPEGYLTKNEMVPIMVDIHLIEGARSGKLILGDTNSIPDYYARIYEKYNISEKSFKESFDWYTQHPELLKEVYTEVIEKLSILDAENKATKAKAPQALEEEKEALE